MTDLRARVEHLEYLLAEMTSPPPDWAEPMARYRLSPQQAAMLAMLLRANGKPVLRQSLRAGMEFAESRSLDGPEERTVDVQACRLRQRLREAGSPLRVLSVRGIGFRLEGMES